MIEYSVLQEFSFDKVYGVGDTFSGPEPVCDRLLESGVIERKEKIPKVKPDLGSVKSRPA